ncbi:MAG: hypothetical protein WKF75_20735, partial [Singulisphaera sp.]
EVIEKAGYGKRPDATGRPEARAPAKVAERLERMDIVAQFAAIRALHEALKTSSSPELEGALVRGYANLGLLTEQNWDPSHKVFKARALLYAQRMVAQAPSSWSLFHRAYARALVGMHNDALNDLEEAEKRPAGEEVKPAWVGLIAASCRFDTAPLEAAGRDDHLGELALLLRFLALEDPATPLVALTAGSDALASAPRPLPGPRRDVQHRRGDQSAPVDRTRPWSGRRGHTPSLEGVARPTGGPGWRFRRGTSRWSRPSSPPEGRPKDTGEPSWAVLGNPIRQARFLGVWRRLPSSCGITCKFPWTSSSPSRCRWLKAIPSGRSWRCTVGGAEWSSGLGPRLRTAFIGPGRCRAHASASR